MRSDVMTSNFMNNKIGEADNGIKSILGENILFRKKIELNQSTSNGYSIDLFITYTFSEYKIIDKSQLKLKDCSNLRDNNYFLSSEENMKVFELLKTLKVGFIEFNKYESTQISFKVKYNEDFDVYDNITLTLPGISDTVMTIGKDYYISNVKRGMKTLENGKYIDKIKHKLIKIDYEEYEYVFTFENLDYNITAYTRGHCRSSENTIHRIDYYVIENNISYFIKNVTAKCVDELCPLTNKSSYTNNKPLYESIREVIDDSFINQIGKDNENN